MPSIDIILNLSPAECLHHYNGRVQWIQAHSTDGCVMAFTAQALRQVVTPQGVIGVFRLEFCDEGRFVSMSRVAKKVHT